eukprot:CAMPEP_0180765020 /NCGR_PEP_ID=MMETSP1038_2-20121128/38757_1 /TAXON_ID=632150 /ORGANISM="Azadinium spinosum, Strain 3D9" /LENGTH=53 /DNA_ID=CAMNT_0022799473 /DNA_START=100 /DNA_END=258 /DNA_ORIENTATION=-
MSSCGVGEVGAGTSAGAGASAGGGASADAGSSDALPSASTCSASTAMLSISPR